MPFQGYVVTISSVFLRPEPVLSRIINGEGLGHTLTGLGSSTTSRVQPVDGLVLVVARVGCQSQPGHRAVSLALGSGNGIRRSIRLDLVGTIQSDRSKLLLGGVQGEERSAVVQEEVMTSEHGVDGAVRSRGHRRHGIVNSNARHRLEQRREGAGNARRVEQSGQGTEEDGLGVGLGRVASVVLSTTANHDGLQDLILARSGERRWGWNWMLASGPGANSGERQHTNRHLSKREIAVGFERPASGRGTLIALLKSSVVLDQRIRLADSGGPGQGQRGKGQKGNRSNGKKHIEKIEKYCVEKGLEVEWLCRIPRG
jgi:hypothetical protein